MAKATYTPGKTTTETLELADMDDLRPGDRVTHRSTPFAGAEIERETVTEEKVVLEMTMLEATQVVALLGKFSGPTSGMYDALAKAGVPFGGKVYLQTYGYDSDTREVHALAFHPHQNWVTEVTGTSTLPGIQA